MSHYECHNCGNRRKTERRSKKNKNFVVIRCTLCKTVTKKTGAPLPSPKEELK